MSQGQYTVNKHYKLQNTQTETIRILLIEDNPGDVRLIQEMLKEEGSCLLYLEHSDRLSKGLKRLAQRGIDLVLLDLMLPDSQYLDTLRRVRTQAPKIPIVILSALDDENLALEAVRKGAEDYLIKGNIDALLLTRSIRYAQERRMLLTQLEESSESRFLKIIKNNADGIIIVDKRGILRFVNPAAESLFDRKAEEIIGELFGFPIIGGKKTEITIIRGDKKTAIAEMRIVEIMWENEPAYLASLRDITERKRAEEKQKILYTKLKESQAQLIQTEKLSAIGTMTAGLAHELNNPLMSILNFIQYSLKHLSNNGRAFPVLQDAEKETHRCIDIIQNLLTFSRREEEDEEAFQKESIAVIIDRVFKILSYQIEKQHILVTLRIAEGTPKIWMRVNNMQQVFFNLIGNALDALKESENKKIHIEISREGEFVKVVVADSGKGIAPENLKKIFDPFYTTKNAGQGTGLGLSICLNIIKTHKGKITCESKLGKGTKFKILFPTERRKYKGGNADEKTYSGN